MARASSGGQAGNSLIITSVINVGEIAILFSTQQSVPLALGTALCGIRTAFLFRSLKGRLFN